MKFETYIALAVVSAAFALVVTLWSNAIEVMMDHEQRITVLEQGTYERE